MIWSYFTKSDLKSLVKLKRKITMVIYIDMLKNNLLLYINMLENKEDCIF